MSTEELKTALNRATWPPHVSDWEGRFEASLDWDAYGNDVAVVWVYMLDPLGRSSDWRFDLREAVRERAMALLPEVDWVAVRFRDINEPVPEPAE